MSTTNTTNTTHSTRSAETNSGTPNTTSATNSTNARPAIPIRYGTRPNGGGSANPANTGKNGAPTITTTTTTPNNERTTRPDAPATERTAPRTVADAFVDERDDVLSVINELEDQLDRNEQIRESLERETTRLTDQNQSLAERCQTLEWQIVTLQTNIDALGQLKQDNTLLEEELADANARAARISEQFARAEKDNLRLTDELKTSTKQCEELFAIRKERDGLRGDVKSARAKLEQLERTQREWNEERTVILGKLQEAQSALEEARGERNQIELNLRAAEDRSYGLQQAMTGLEQKFEDIRNERKTLHAQIARHERENARLSEQQQFFEVEIASLRNTNRNSEAALANVKKAFAEVRIALTETKSRARRRSIENLPRVASALRGLDGETSTGDETDTGTPRRMAATASADSATTSPGVWSET